LPSKHARRCGQSKAVTGPDAQQYRVNVDAANAGEGDHPVGTATHFFRIHIVFAFGVALPHNGNDERKKGSRSCLFVVRV